MTDKVQIKDIYGKVLFEYDKENNTIKDTVVKAIEEGVSLNCANLNYADLRNADLRYANLKNVLLINADLIGANLKNADLSNADLIGADLRNADLSGVNLRIANLSCANLYDANLYGANLYSADLVGADLVRANLSYADLSNANLRNAYLKNADLKNAHLNYANLKDVNLSGVKNIPHIPFVCPSEGSFIGWKKISHYKENYEGEFLVKLLIPEDAKRSSATTNKCRCDKAKVLKITNIFADENVDVITNTNYRQCVYKVGEFVYPDSFEENRWNECSNGIHFFIDKQEAINY